MNLRDLSEFGTIERIRSRLGSSPASLRLLDDAAIIGATGQATVVTTDSLVEDIHFRRDWSSASDIGFKAIAVNVSDIEAMGAEPDHVLLSLHLSPDEDVSFLDGLIDGVAEACEEFGVAVAGGDTVRSPVAAIGVTALGRLNGDPLLRSAAKPGDALAVTGPLGLAAAGVELLTSGQAAKSPECVEAHRRPAPRRGIGAGLRSAGVACAMDLSDGLASDARRIAEASGLGVEIDAALVPIAEPVLALAAETGWDALALAIGGGEDYEILVAAPEEVAVRAGCTVVGRMIEEGNWLIAQGKRTPLEGLGWDNFG